MRNPNEKVDMGNYTTIEIDEYGTLTVTFDDGDFAVEVPLEARCVLSHLQEYYQEQTRWANGSSD